jgi:hypothetical protein
MQEQGEEEEGRIKKGNLSHYQPCYFAWHLVVRFESFSFSFSFSKAQTDPGPV